MSLLRQGKAQVLTIYLGESDQWQGTPLYVAIVQFLREPLMRLSSSRWWTNRIDCAACCRTCRRCSAVA